MRQKNKKIRENITNNRKRTNENEEKKKRKNNEQKYQANRISQTTERE